MYEFDQYVFTPMCRSAIFHVLLTVHGALIHLQQTIYWILTQTTLQTQTFCHLLGLDEWSSVAYSLGETQTSNHISLLFSREKLLLNPRKRVAIGQENFEVLNCCYIQIYQTSFLLS